MCRGGGGGGLQTVSESKFGFGLKKIVGVIFFC